MKQYILLVLNTLTLAVALVVNYLSGTGISGDATVGDISDKYPTLFTPAGYAFGIWGLIYLLLVCFLAYQWFEWLRFKQDENLKRTGIWFALSNLANASWIFAWVNESIGISVILTLIILASLVVLMFRLRLETWDAPVRVIAFVWWPVCVYLGWIITATVANFSVYFKSIGWDGGFLSEQAWTVVMIIAATLIYILLIYYRNMREAAAAGIWALIAIAVKQQETTTILYTALFASVILFIYISWHGFKNRETSPFIKVMRGEI